MRNNAPGGVGNDVGLDDITFRPAGPAVSVNISNTVGPLMNVCAASQQDYLFTSTVEQCYAATAYRWQLSSDTGKSWKNIPGAVNSTYTRLPTLPGVYWYRLAVAPAANIEVSTCRVVSDPIQVTVLQEPVPDLGPDTVFCQADSLLLNPGKFDTYAWQNGSVQSSMVVKKPGNYSVTVSNSCGSGSDAVSVQEINCAIRFPSAFSPNNDNNNDGFKVLHAYRIKDFQLAVFNRWGQKVFATTDPLKAWDGTVNGRRADTGLFIWQCSFVKTGTGERVNMKGSVLLIR